MTYIVGWKYRGSIYLVSDTAITRNKNENDSVRSSSFGETPGNSNDLSVNEECFKIFQIDNDCIIAITGNVNNAVEFIEKVSNCSSASKRLDFLNQFSGSIYDKDFDGIVGLCQNGKVKLYTLKCGSKTNFEEVKESVVCLGSGTSRFQSKTKQLIDEIKGEKMYPTERMQLMVSGHQLLSVNENSFKTGVGGVFNGARLSKHGVSWNEDVSYILYSEKTTIYPTIAEIKDDSYIIFAFNRGGMLYILSPHPKPIGTDKLIPSCKFANHKNFHQIEKEWESQFYGSIRASIFNNSKPTKYISFIYRDFEESYTVLSVIMKGVNKIKYRMIYEGNGNFDLRLPTELLEKLTNNHYSKKLTCLILK